jgi:hydrogenase maturation protein HypF
MVCVSRRFVMTSANPPNEPIVTDNDEAVKKLGSVVDYFLFHDRLIAQRCDAPPWAGRKSNGS